MMEKCPSCRKKIEIDDDIEDGDFLECEECGAELIVTIIDEEIFLDEVGDEEDSD